MYGLVMDNSCDPGDPLATGIFARCSWQLNPYIAGDCYHRDTGQNHPGTQTCVAFRSERKNIKSDSEMKCYLPWKLWQD